jgi:hypothetical protein
MAVLCVEDTLKIMTMDKLFDACGSDAKCGRALWLMYDP